MLEQMKAVVYISMLFLLFACNDSELEQLKLENTHLKTEKSKQDSILNTISITYGDIDSNAKIIDKKKQLINDLVHKGKLSEQEKEIILAEMDSINMLIEENRNQVTQLEGSLNDSSSASLGLKNVVRSMDDKISIEDNKVTEMKQDLAQVSKDFSELFEEYVYKEVENMEMKEQLSSQAKELKQAQQKLDQAKEKLHAAWYVIGTSDQLKAKGLIYKKGFFDDQEVNEDFDKSQFKKVDISELMEILLDSKKSRNHDYTPFRVLRNSGNQEEGKQVGHYQS